MLSSLKVPDKLARRKRRLNQREMDVGLRYSSFPSLVEMGITAREAEVSLKEKTLEETD